MPSVVRLSTTPVKSTRLHHPDSITLDRHGALGDRDFYLVNERGNLFATGRYGPMLMVTSGFDSAAGRLSFAFPDGTKLEGASDAGEEPIRTDFFGRFVDGHHMPDFWNERLSAYLGMPVRLVRCDEAGAASDVYPVTLMSSASVEELGRRAGEADATNPDGRRFRMLIEVDGCEPHEEDTWDGSRVRVGAATLAMKGQVPRCAATNLSPATGEKDFNTLKILNAYRAGGEITMPFGVYAEVETPGVVTVGDVLEFAAASEAPHAAAQST